MAEFLIRQDWGKRRSTERRQSKPKNCRQGNTLVERSPLVKIVPTSIISGRPAESVHHEPPRNEMIGARGDLKSQTRIDLTLPEHAAFHHIRYRMYRNEGDQNAEMGILCRFTDAQSDEYEDIMTNPEALKYIEDEIVWRRKNYNVRC